MAEKKVPSFEENLEKLESIVKKLETGEVILIKASRSAKFEEIVKELESGEVPLDDAINKYTEAMKLAKTCDEKLKNAEEAITKLVKDNGDVVDFKVEE